MKDMINTLFKKFKEYFFLMFGFIYIYVYIYVAFIRQRLPKDIPFDLTEFKFYSLCFVCLMYIYIIYRIIYPKNPSTFIINLLSYIQKPLVFFFNFLLKIKFISKHYFNICLKLFPILDSWDIFDNVIFLYLLSLIPRLILLSIFIVDVLFLHRIEVFYYFIFLGLFPIIYLLFIKYLENISEEYLETLETLYTNVAIFEEGIDHANFKHNPNAIYHDKIVSLRKYIDIQHETSRTYGDNNEYIEYSGYPFSKALRYKEHENINKKTIKEMSLNDLDILNKEFNYLIPKILLIKFFLECQMKNALKIFYVYEIKLFILVMYLICWLYILIVSVHTLHDIPLTMNILHILTKYSKILEPFSGTFY